MKKIIIITMALILVFSLCACSNTVVTPDGKVIESKFEKTTFTVMWDDVSSNKYGEDYYVQMENDEYIVLLETNVKFFMMYDANDTVVCEFKLQESNAGACDYTAEVKWEDYCFHAKGVIAKG